MLLLYNFAICAILVFEKIAKIILRNFDFCTNNFGQICENLVCDAEQCGILRKSCSASCANDAQKLATFFCV